MTTSGPAIAIASVGGAEPERIFTSGFRIGRGPDCEVRALVEAVSRRHVEVQFDSGHWWIVDLGSANGVFVQGRRIVDREKVADGDGPTVLSLGTNGPRFALRVLKPAVQPDPPAPEDLSSVTQFITRVMHRGTDEPVSDRTLFMREAMRRMARRQSRRYLWVAAVALLVLVGAGGYIWEQHRRLEAMQQIASNIFYSMKQLELQTATLEHALVDTAHATQLATNRSKLRELESQYERFLEVNKIGAFEAKLNEQERLVFRIARLFGECDAEMPREFIDTVMRYVRAWQSTDRLATAMQRAESLGYISKVGSTMLAENLPPQFFYLALQESSFNARAVGPQTYAGIAKGIWQFIPSTAERYGLKVGPLAEMPRYDPNDERFNLDKATRAAARYLKSIYATDAQASGLLVMASYNWGEGKVVRLIKTLPANPRDRNFWQLLKRYRGEIPQETYNYVLYIVSAAVIGENPALFGFSFKNPYADLK